jgi:hypothetical protein
MLGISLAGPFAMRRTVFVVPRNSLESCFAAAHSTDKSPVRLAAFRQENRKTQSNSNHTVPAAKITEGRSTLSFSSISRLLVRAGFPPLPASPRMDTGWRQPIRYYWFKCPNCKQVVADYPHGYSKQLMCPRCNEPHTGPLQAADTQPSSMA